VSDQRIRILYFSNTQVRGGAEEHILTLLRGLDRGVFAPSLACTPEVAEALEPDMPDDVQVTPLRLRKPSDTRAALELKRLISQDRAMVLHSHLFYSSLFASPIGRLCRVPLIVETPHVREQWRKGFKASYAVDRLFGLAVDVYIAVSEANARYLVESKGLPPQKILTIHNGCDLKRFDPGHRPPDGMRESLGFAPDARLLMVMARLEPQKGHRVLLAAMALVRQRMPNVGLVCIGEGALRAELEAQAAALGLLDCVRFVGQQTNIADWYALSDVTVLPSFYEGLPLVAIESLAAGRPVVATAVDGTPEVVVDGETGLIVPPGDSPSLAEAIVSILGDVALRCRLAIGGRQWVLDHFSAEQQVARTETLYKVGLRGRGYRVAIGNGVHA